jgi:hypothetical protein
MKILTLSLLLLFTCTLAYAQSVEYGQASDLKGIRRVFVDTGDDLKNRERIIKEIEKAKLNLELLNSPEGAELVLSFSSEILDDITDVKTLPPLAPGLPARSRVEHQNSERGKGFAFVPISPDRRRILFNWSGEQTLRANTATKFASAFVKTYKKANGLK